MALKQNFYKIAGNPIILEQSNDQTWITKGTMIKISHAVLTDVSADTTDAVILAKDSSSAAASDLCVRDARSGVNTVLFSEPQCFSMLYCRNLSAGRLEIYLE